jgi:hypothetical protein
MLPNSIAINIKEDAMGFIIISSKSKPPCPVIRAARLSRRLAMDYDAPTAPDLFVSAFRFEDITYGATGNSFAFHGITPEDDFGVQLVGLRA